MVRPYMVDFRMGFMILVIVGTFHETSLHGIYIVKIGLLLQMICNLNLVGNRRKVKIISQSMFSLEKSRQDL